MLPAIFAKDLFLPSHSIILLLTKRSEQSISVERSVTHPESLLISRPASTILPRAWDMRSSIRPLW